MRIAIIGAGASGLAAIQKAIQYNVECTAFEITDKIGGVWQYREKNDLSHNNPMYPKLRTNFPTQLMQYEDFKFEPKSGLSFPHHTEVLDYLNKFDKHYDLSSHIKFQSEVTKVSRIADKWSINVKDLNTNDNKEYEFDGVMICTGHYWKPSFPKITGMDTFSGHQMHSVNYRRNHIFKDKKVIVVGSGPSGLDISLDVAEVAKKVVLSYSREPVDQKLDENIEVKPRLCFIKSDTAYFEDGSYESFDDIIYCTGYKYYFPFLDSSCGIEIDDGAILKPLFLHLFNIRHPSMCFIGLLEHISLTLFPLQAEVYMKYMIKNVQLPSTCEMLESWKNEYTTKMKKNLPKSSFYRCEQLPTSEYLNHLTELGKSKPVKTVLNDMQETVFSIIRTDFIHLRSYSFQTLDDNNFIYCKD